MSMYDSDRPTSCTVARRRWRRVGVGVGVALVLVWALVWARANHLGHRLLNVKILNLIPLLCGLVLNVNAVAASLEWAYVALLLLTRG